MPQIMAWRICMSVAYPRDPGSRRTRRRASPLRRVDEIFVRIRGAEEAVVLPEEERAVLALLHQKALHALVEEAACRPRHLGIAREKTRFLVVQEARRPAASPGAGRRAWR